VEVGLVEKGWKTGQTVVNLGTARQIGISIPAHLLAGADQIVDGGRSNRHGEVIREGVHVRRGQVTAARLLGAIRVPFGAEGKAWPPPSVVIFGPLCWMTR
jgi:hypothetical protein